MFSKECEAEIRRAMLAWWRADEVESESASTANDTGLDCDIEQYGLARAEARFAQTRLDRAIYNAVEERVLEMLARDA